MHALHGVLQRHRRDAGKAGQQRGWAVGVRERAVAHGEQEKREQQEHFQNEEHAQHGKLPRAHQRSREPRQRDHQDEFGQRQDLAMMPWLPEISAAPSVTKFPVTCAVNRPCKPRKPAVSTKPR